MAKKHPCNCQQAVPGTSGTAPPPGAIRQALGALAPSATRTGAHRAATIMEVSSTIPAPIAPGGVELDHLLELVRSNPGLKITLSFDAPAPPRD